MDTYGGRLARQDENTALLSVRDDGVGLPAGFDLKKSLGLGMRIVAALSKQLGAAISHRWDFYRDCIHTDGPAP